MNMKRFEFEQLMANIQDKLSYYKYENINERRYSLILANGDRIKVRFPEFCVPHLLGINTNYLQSTGLFKEKTAMGLLREMCDNEFRVYNLMNRRGGHITEENLFSSYVIEKVNSFSENLKIIIYDVDFVCKYDKSKAYTEGENGYDFDYLICKRNDKGEVFVTGLVKSNDGYYVPRTNQYYKNMDEAEEKLSKILKNQEITFVANVDISDFNSFTLSARQKIIKTLNLEKLSLKFNSSVNVLGDYKFALNKYQDNLSKGRLITREYESVISSCMEQGEIIEPKSFGLDNFDSINVSLVQIIMSYNNLITSCDIRLSDNVQTKYSDAINELHSLKEECKNYKKINEELSSDNKSLQNRVSELETKSSSYLDTIDAIDSAIQKVKSTKN